MLVSESLFIVYDMGIERAGARAGCIPSEAARSVGFSDHSEISRTVRRLGLGGLHVRRQREAEAARRHNEQERIREAFVRHLSALIQAREAAQSAMSARVENASVEELIALRRG